LTVAPFQLLRFDEVPEVRSKIAGSMTIQQLAATTVALILAPLFAWTQTDDAAMAAATTPPIVSDRFNTGKLDTSKWMASNSPAPGNISGVNYGSFIPANVDLSKGMLCLKLQQQQGPNGVHSVGGEIQSLTTLGYGTYEWVMRASSTSSTPGGAGSVASGQISGAFIFVNNSQTEVDFEVEGQNPNTLWMTNWTSVTQKQYSSTAVVSPQNGFHHYKFVWGPGKIDFFLDGKFVSRHTVHVPKAPAYILINHWGTNSKGWGGKATPGVQRYLYISSFKYTASPF